MNQLMLRLHVALAQPVRGALAAGSSRRRRAGARCGGRSAACSTPWSRRRRWCRGGRTSSPVIVIIGAALVGAAARVPVARKMLPWADDRVGRAVALGGVVGVVEQAVDGLVAARGRRCAGRLAGVARRATTAPGPRRPRRARPCASSARRRHVGTSSSVFWKARSASGVGGAQRVVGRRSAVAAPGGDPQRVDRVARAAGRAGGGRWPARTMHGQLGPQLDVRAPGARRRRRSAARRRRSTRTPLEQVDVRRRCRAGSSPCLASATREAVARRSGVGAVGRAVAVAAPRWRRRLDVPQNASWRPLVSLDDRQQHPAHVGQQQRARRRGRPATAPSRCRRR